MTAKEYFNKMWCFFDNHTEDGEGILLSKVSEQRGIDILQEYADQETEKLKAELSELQKMYRFMEWKEGLRSEMRGDKLMYDVPKHYKLLESSELLNYFIEHIYF